MMMTNPGPRIDNADEPSLKCYEKPDDIFDVFNSLIRMGDSESNPVLLVMFFKR